jgi:hypothetical protein
MKHSVEVFEVDCPRCTLEYGVTCSAAIGVTGDDKCFNSPGSCQVPLEFGSETMVVRWISNSEELIAHQVNAVPGLLSVDTQPQIIKPGESLGKRERANVSLKDHPHNDYGFDPYIEERGYNPFKQGTFLGKFAARWPNPQGYEARHYLGEYDPESGDFLAGLEVGHYVVDKFKRALGGVQFSIKDALSFTDDEKVLCPVPNNGVLDAVLLVGASSFTLEPAGIGDTYSTSGYGTIGGKEFVSFTRVGDVVTLTGRGLRDSEQKQHDEGSSFQEAAHLTGNVATVLAALLSYTDTPQEYYDSEQQAIWQAEAAEFASEILDGMIAAPTGVGTLINSLMTEMGLDIHTDIYAKKIIMRVLRPLAATGEFSEDNLKAVLPDTDNDSRIDTVYFHFGRINPVEKINEFSNYAGHLLRIDENPYAVINNNTSRIKEIFSLFIPATLQQSASDRALMLVKRYNRLLKMAKGKTTPEFSANLGDIVGMTNRFFQDSRGLPLPSFPMQVVSVEKSPGEHQLTFQEYSFGDFEFEGGRTVSILVNMLNVNLRTLYESAYGTATIPTGTAIVFEGTGTAETDAVMGGSIQGGISVTAGDWPEIADGVTLEIRNVIIAGKGANGGNPSHPNGFDGNKALYTRVPILATNCIIGAGGGGGGAAYYGTGFGNYWVLGNGGAGYLAGSGNTPGTLFEGGEDASGAGDGGDLGAGGGSSGSGPGTFYAGGAAGVAIDGTSYVTQVGCTIYGAEIN